MSWTEWALIASNLLGIWQAYRLGFARGQQRR